MAYRFGGYAAFFALMLTWADRCQAQLPRSSVRDEPAPGVTLTTDQQARRAALIENAIATRLALMRASESQVRSVLKQCRSAIRARAMADNVGTYPVWLIDAPESKAGSRLAATVDASIANVDERWDRFANFPDGTPRRLRSDLDLAWAVVFTADGDSHPTKQVVRYECGLDRTLGVFIKEH